MEKIIGINAVSNVVITMGDYIPVTVKFSDELLNRLYLRFGNQIRSLLELAFHNVTGELIEIELVNADKLLIRNEPVISFSQTPEYGTPLVDPSTWSSTDMYIDVDRDFILSLSEKFLYIQLSNICINTAPIYNKCISCGPVSFFLNQHTNYIDVIMLELSNQQRECIKRYCVNKINRL